MSTKKPVIVPVTQEHIAVLLQAVASMQASNNAKESAYIQSQVIETMRQRILRLEEKKSTIMDMLTVDRDDLQRNRACIMTLEKRTEGVGILMGGLRTVGFWGRPWWLLTGRFHGIKP